MSDAAPLLTMRGIVKRFSGVTALANANFEVTPAEVHALVGQNGAGKSTLIKILTGYYRRDEGEVTFLGRPFHPGSPQEAQRAGISTIYQEINLVGYRSVAENICLGHEMRRFGLLDWKRIHRTAEELLARFNVHIDVRRPLRSYSTATQQMVAIARSMGFAARLVIMDEPTSSLTDREIDVLFGVIRQLKAEGVSVVFVSHKLDELYAVCDRVTVMRDGRTVGVAPLAELPKLDLVATMLGRDVGSVAQQGSTGFGRKRMEAARPTLAVQNLAAPPLVRRVDARIGEGEIVGLAGLLGSGRTDTGRVLFGDMPVESGELSLGGERYAPRGPWDAIAARIGFCPEDRKVEGLVPEMSVRENITLALLPVLARSGVVDEKEQERIVKEFIRRLNIRCSSPEQPIRELSGGNQQKVLLARWLCTNPSLLILDEPTRGIDVGAKAEIQALIRELADSGLGVLMISSEVEEIVEGADRAYVMRDGRTVVELAGEALTEAAVLAAMAQGDETSTNGSGRIHV